MAQAQAIVAQFGVSCGTIWHISNEKRWSEADAVEGVGSIGDACTHRGTQCAPPPLHPFPAATRHLGWVAPLGRQQSAPAVLAALQTLQAGRGRREKHRVASFQYESLRRRLEFLLTFDQDLRDLAAELLQGAGRRGRGLADSRNGWATMWRITMSKTAYRGRPVLALTRGSGDLARWQSIASPSSASGSCTGGMFATATPASGHQGERHPMDFQRHVGHTTQTTKQAILPGHLSQSHFTNEAEMKSAVRKCSQI